MLSEPQKLVATILPLSILPVCLTGSEFREILHRHWRSLNSELLHTHGKLSPFTILPFGCALHSCCWGTVLEYFVCIDGACSGDNELCCWYSHPIFHLQYGAWFLEQRAYTSGVIEERILMEYLKVALDIRKGWPKDIGRWAR